MQGADPPRGVVRLHDKRVPTEDQPPDSRPRVDGCCVSYGDVGIEPFRALLLAQPEDFWQDEELNVRIARPFHDNLGVRKVIFKFSDTAAAPQVFYLPRWAEWRPLLEAIFTKCKLSEAQVVRCLLARLPPGAEIPPHHDNGKWVAHTHRVHVAVLTSPDVHFHAGPTFNEMQRYAFNPGVAVELNNAAKHAVANRGQQMRVHLILDWVEPEVVARLPPAVTLRVGQLIRQVRGRVEIVETEAERVRSGGAGGRKEWARRLRAVEACALRLGGEALRHTLLEGRPALMRKW
jgi:hypothetical protein|eukprot:SAG25_NODE_291_length_10320_cov_2.259219_5_plen_291_part_00